MSKTIAIIGAGTAGLQLGLHLLQNGITPKLYTDRTPEEYAGARLMNTVAHHHVTTEREDALGCNHWPSDEYGYYGHYHYIGTPDQIFAGTSPFQAAALVGVPAGLPAYSGLA